MHADPSTDASLSSFPRSVTAGRRVALVEDDGPMRDLLRTLLERQGYQVHSYGSAEALMPELQPGAHDLLVLDIGLPGLSGLQLCERLRAKGLTTPMMLLTARADEVDRVIGLELGADDYLVKPFSSRELLARVKALLRRSAIVTGHGTAAENVAKVGEGLYNLRTRTWVHGVTARLLNTVDNAILAELVRQAGRPVPREVLFEVSHHGHEPATLRAVDSAIWRLRQMIEADPAQPQVLQTVRGYGYVFSPDATAG